MRYVLRRMAQMIPTLLGVVVLTFVLFHVVGGSPAAMILGDHISPQMLEEFDEIRGFNRPLFWGRWVSTRAVADIQRPDTAVRLPFEPVDETTPPADGRRLEPGDYRLIPRFDLPSAPRYRLSLQLDASPGATVEWYRMPPGATHEARHPDTQAALRRGRTIVHFDPEEGAPVLRVRNGAVIVEELRLRRGMDHRWDSQFAYYLRRLARLDLGVSSIENRPVSEILIEGIGPTLALTMPILLGGLATSLLLSLICARFHGRRLDRTIGLAAIALMSVNYVVWIVFGQYVFAFRLGWFPVWGFESWRYLLLPVAVGVVSGLGADVRFYRTVMIEEIHREYVQTARAKGVGTARLLFRHVLPNALVPVLAQTASALPFLYTGSLLLESFFGIPGLGYLGVNAVNSADVDVLRAVVLMGSVLFMAINLLADLAYAVVDPRVKLK